MELKQKEHFDSLVELVLLQLLQNPTKVLLMFWWGLAKDKDIIKVDHAADIEMFM